MAITTTTPLYFNSTDDGAPQVTSNVPASFLAVIKACLIGSGGTAYGSKPAAGWTLAFEDGANNAVAYQMPGGNQRFFRLGNPTTDATNPGYGNYSYFEVRGYNAMTNVNTGTNPFPSVAQHSTFRWVYAAQLATTTATNIPWSIMVSENFLYMQFQVGNGGNNQSAAWGAHFAAYFGDVVSYVPNDTMQTIISGFWASAYNVAGSPNWSTNGAYYAYLPFKSSDNLTDNNTYCYVYGSSQQIYGPYPAQPHWDEGFYPGAANGWAGYGGMSNPSPSGQFVFQKALFFENPTNPTIRGEMPGLLIPLHTRPFPDQYQLTIGSDDYISWIGTPGGNSTVQSYNIYLNMGSWKTN